MKINVVLFQPEIPQSTGNISRTCSVTSSALHLVHPVGFSMDERHLRRAGLDYWDGLEIHQYRDNASFFAQHADKTIWYFSQKGRLSIWDPKALLPTVKDDVQGEVWLAFGCESKGLPEELLLQHPDTCVRIPMLDGKRSLNLSNAVAIAVYEVIRRNGAEGLRTMGQLSEHTWGGSNA